MIGNVIANGIGAPSDIAHNILFGLSPSTGTPESTIGGGYPITQPTRDHRALLNRDYRAPVAPKRISRQHARASGVPALAFAYTGLGRARGTIGSFSATASGVMAAGFTATTGEGSVRISVTARGARPKALTPKDYFLMGYLAGQEDA